MKSKNTIQRTYPRDVWVLSPAYIPKQVTVVAKSVAWSSLDYGDRTAGGKCYRPEDMHETKESAIQRGRALIQARQEWLAKQEALLAKRSKTLDKAEAA